MLLVFRCHYVSILYRFWDTISYLPKFKEVTWDWTHRFYSLLVVIDEQTCCEETCEMASCDWVRKSHVIINWYFLQMKIAGRQYRTHSLWAVRGILQQMSQPARRRVGTITAVMALIGIRANRLVTNVGWLDRGPESDRSLVSVSLSTSSTGHTVVSWSMIRCEAITFNAQLDCWRTASLIYRTDTV